MEVIVYDGLYVSDEETKNGVDKSETDGFHESGTRKIYINIDKVENTESLMATVAHEMNHVDDMDRGIAYDGLDGTREDVAHASGDKMKSFFQDDFGVTKDNHVENQSWLYNQEFSSENSLVNDVDKAEPKSYLVIWQSKDDETGHAGFAVDNYDEKGNPTGSVQYYDLWPKKSVGISEFQNDVEANYNSRLIESKDDLLVSDPSVSGLDGYVSEFGEGRPPDNIAELPSIYEKDLSIKIKMEELVSENKNYNGSYNNCSNFSKEGVKIVFPKIDGSELVKPSFPLNSIYSDVDVVTPNKLFNDLSDFEEVKFLKGDKKIKSKPYLEYFDKENRR